jgi:pilus assembly protein Flp/PilA
MRTLYTTGRQFIVRLVRATDGQDLIEYALLAGIIALGVVTAMGSVKTALSGQFTNISTKVSTGS